MMMPSQAAAPEMKKMPLDQLHLDPRNPRLTEEVRSGGEEAIIEWMLKDGNIIELMASISATGYSDAEPVLVAPNPDERVGGYIVVEGNRRLTAVKLLNDPSKAHLRSKMVKLTADEAYHDPPKELPVLIYKRRDDILDYLGYRHITGIKAWRAREKAEYLWQLYQRNTDAPHNQDANVLKKVAKVVGSNANAAKKTIVTLQLVKQAEETAFWDSGSEIERDDVEFSVLGTALSYSEIKQFLGIQEDGAWGLSNLNAENVKSLFSWLFGKNKKVSESRKIKTLAKIVASEEALRKLKEGQSLDIAAEYSSEAIENYRMLMSNAMAQLREADNYSTRAVDNLTAADVDNAKDCSTLARKIYKYIYGEVNGPSDD
ncbi:MAG: ParB N-terminal domain-containing protein [Candidatus Adiutrix sp.]|jgi:hypothetical protein|nr:ParB N-terminal domain-containing protein [Candidatus Adiutrix sp.]